MCSVCSRLFNVKNNDLDVSEKTGKFLMAFVNFTYTYLLFFVLFFYIFCNKIKI